MTAVRPVPVVIWNSCIIPPLFLVRKAGPLLEEAVPDIEKAQHFAHGMIDHFIDILRLVVEGGGGGHDNGTHFGQLHHGAEVTEVEGGFPYQQEQLAPFLQRDIAGTDHQVVGIGVGQGGHRIHGTGSDNHAIMEERTAGEPGAHIGI